MFEENVIAGFKFDELRAGNLGGEKAALVYRRHRVLACVKDERRRADLRQQ